MNTKTRQFGAWIAKIWVAVTVVAVALSMLGCVTEDSGNGLAGASGPPGLSRDCVDYINQLRATLDLAALQRWEDGESCAAQQSADDMDSSDAHSNFGDCGEWAQNTCPNWNGDPEENLTGCLDLMWAEGPGDGAAHGHYRTMTSTQYNEVACGVFITADGSRWWSNQNFR